MQGNKTAWAVDLIVSEEGLISVLLDISKHMPPVRTVLFLAGKSKKDKTNIPLMHYTGSFQRDILHR